MRSRKGRPHRRLLATVAASCCAVMISVGLSAAADLPAAPSSAASSGTSPDAAPAGAGAARALPYPSLSDYRIKGVVPDTIPKAEVARSNTGTVHLNLIWADWEPRVKSSPCGKKEQEFGGHCFRIDAQLDADIKEWTGLGVNVMAVVYGTPDWARVTVLDRV
ncbi:hypothetical protein [Streptomyces sp. AK02-04a]|uniref:hypothetical protein n=1 Tax=Streptomyces sp. AK02-04a TaxID=3028649 RepID=UPI0029B37DEB|nr:hypothetical protein [Streptomyces sp. AK02-04a]MDX3763875.1 hypothetical protein [Streptomyces sp. AK02-04a]